MIRLTDLNGPVYGSAGTLAALLMGGSGVDEDGGGSNHSADASGVQWGILRRPTNPQVTVGTKRSLYKFE